jgi:hypothetical protein
MQGHTNSDCHSGQCRCRHCPHARYLDEEGKADSIWKPYDGEETLKQIEELNKEIVSIRDDLGKRISNLEKLRENQPKE